MKNMVRMIALALVALPVFAVAQLEDTQKLVTNVPFEFVMGSKIAAAGEYTLQSLGAGSGLIVLRNYDTKFKVISPLSSDDMKTAAPKCALVFHKYGDRHFLAGVKIEGSRVMYRVPQSKAEAELRAENVTAQEEILLAQLR